MTQLYFLRHETHRQLQVTDELEWTSIILKYIAEISSDKIPCNIRIKKTSQCGNKITIIGKSYAYLEQHTGEIYGITRKKNKIKIGIQQYRKQSQITHKEPLDDELHPWLEWNIIFENNKKLKSGIIIIHTKEIGHTSKNVKTYLTTNANERPAIRLTSDSLNKKHRDVMNVLTKNYKSIKKFDTGEEIKNDKPVNTWKIWIMKECTKKCPQYCLSLIKKNISHLVKIALSTIIGYFLRYGTLYIIFTIILILSLRMLRQSQIKKNLSVANITSNYIKLSFEYLMNLKKRRNSRFKKTLNRISAKKEKTEACIR